MPESTQPAMVPAAPKSRSAGWAATQRMRSTSEIGAGEGGKLIADQLKRPRNPVFGQLVRSPYPRCQMIFDLRFCGSEQRSTPGSQDQQRQLYAVGSERLAEAIDDLPLPLEHQPGPAGSDPHSADLAGDRGSLAPQLDQLAVDLVDSVPKIGDLFRSALRAHGNHRPAPARWCIHRLEGRPRDRKSPGQ